MNCLCRSTQCVARFRCLPNLWRACQANRALALGGCMPASPRPAHVGAAAMLWASSANWAAPALTSDCPALLWLTTAHPGLPGAPASGPAEMPSSAWELDGDWDLALLSSSEEDASNCRQPPVKRDCERCE